jgi:hypothetical protein
MATRRYITPTLENALQKKTGWRVPLLPPCGDKVGVSQTDRVYYTEIITEPRAHKHASLNLYRRGFEETKASSPPKPSNSARCGVLPKSAALYASEYIFELLHRAASLAC